MNHAFSSSSIRKWEKWPLYLSIIYFLPKQSHCDLLDSVLHKNLKNFLQKSSMNLLQSQKHAFLLTFVSQIRTKKGKSLVTEIQLSPDFKWPQRSWKYWDFSWIRTTQLISVSLLSTVQYLSIHFSDYKMKKKRLFLMKGIFVCISIKPFCCWIWVLHGAKQSLKKKLVLVITLHVGSTLYLSNRPWFHNTLTAISNCSSVETWEFFSYSMSIKLIYT